MRTDPKELLALGMFGRGSRLGERIVLLLGREREFSAHVSKSRLLLSTIASLALATGSSRIPRWIAFAQASQPKFAVTSVKPNQLGCCMEGGFGNGQGGGRDISLRMLIASTYRMQQFQVVGGPGWVDSDRFDVEGKAEDRKADFDQLRLMMRSLLEDRFALKVHRETRESPVYALSVGKGGPKIRLSDDHASPDMNGPSEDGVPARGNIRFGGGSLGGNAVPLSRFTFFLSQRLDRNVIDKTNLTGRYDIALHWTPSPGENPLDPGGSTLPPPDPNGPSIFTAIQEQLGLKLESAKGPVEVLVIDHAEKPDSN